MNKIEKISDDKKYYSESEFVEDIIKKVNEIIEVLNNLLSEPRTLKLSLDDAKKIKKELKNSRRELQPSKITPAEDEWKEELRFLYGDLYYRNEDGEFCRIVNEIDDLIDFISQLLSEEYQRGVKEGTEGKFYEKIEVVSQIPEEVVEQLLSERTFSKEELRLLNAYLSLALPEYNNFDKETKMHEDMDKLHKILEKLSKLLKEEE